MKLKEYITLEWKRRFLSENLLLSKNIDITPLIDFLTSTLVEWIKNRYFYVPTSSEYDDLRRIIRDEVMDFIKYRLNISLHDAISLLTKIFEKKYKDIIEHNLENKGIIFLKSYDQIRALFKSNLRWRILVSIAKIAFSVEEIAKMLRCREEVVRRILSELKQLGIIEEKVGLSKRGRPIKLFKLKANVFIINLRYLNS